jgi:hypothetical protein
MRRGSLLGRIQSAGGENEAQKRTHFTDFECKIKH